VVVPFSRLEDRYIPSTARIVAAAKKALAFA